MQVPVELGGAIAQELNRAKTRRYRDPETDN